MADKVKFIKNCGWTFPCVLLVYASANYFSFAYLIVYERFKINTKSIVLLATFHFFALMFVWSYLATALTDPGKVPQYWGFFMENPETQQKKYCLHCHTYKPERCHHCSLCNRCVLNMDHHCPWVGNCVGFYNKKFFILLLFYSYISLLIMFGTTLYEIVHILLFIKAKGFGELGWKDFYITASFIALSILTFIITFFLRFHLLLVSKNLTTLENLDLKRGKHPVDYDVGDYNNWVQVFGKDVIMWFWPFFTEGSRPVGDGVIWARKAVFNREGNVSSEQELMPNTNTTRQEAPPVKTNNENYGALGSPNGAFPHYINGIRNQDYQNMYGNQQNGFVMQSPKGFFK
eukprot:TRINITY_DN4245_c0_g1_i1.p1 TRINITY_DN4245_c0_g1~~TRINITY_DN4245_c0_g1_i1.p1  ORF type:complete len:346 (-),score=57.87 TRINITY_DN4245_c0_g1_i1:184-1221(-)